MSRVLITGATGMVGQALLNKLAAEPRVGQIIAVTRRALPPLDNVTNIVNPRLEEALSQLETPLDSAFCCLGTTRRQAGSREAFSAVDKDRVIDTALAARRLGASHMLVVSAAGANAVSPFFYNRVKGEMEAALIAQQWPYLTIARPSMLLGERQQKRWSEELLAPLFRMLPTGWRSIAASDVASAMLEEMLTPAQHGVTVLTNQQMHDMAAKRR
ncbi:NAD(P)H-binding protein [Entomohabitans teleogrylli]|uniref:NAD(P)H-binding protein n=1 Tax=Entomohabitans teleogrylli TaxID=1384589 RepID=UPI00073D221E|nr:NAD(P)H-binding protein [Entomohabitans teleogrylli]